MRKNQMRWLSAVAFTLIAGMAGSASAQWTVSGNNAYFNLPGNVGIGTTAPAAKLDVFGTSILGKGPTDTVYSNGNVYFIGGSDASTASSPLTFLNNRLLVWRDNAGTVAAAGFLWYDNANRFNIGTANGTRLQIDASGNVTVTGNLTASKVINAVYQDIAEWVETNESLSAGTVVVLNPNAKDSVMASKTAYDTTVAGVVSAEPGVVLGKASPTKATIATTGRVRVHVDARKNPIHVGDLLVTSDVAGTAMKSEAIDIGGRKFHQPGTIIGKALEEKSGGVGDILVLLSLQ